MQTFLPYPDFKRSAESLDRKRLGNQRREALVLLHGGWPNHPASRMWQGYFYQLACYGIVICKEWIRRGYQDSCQPKFAAELLKYQNTGFPPWFGNPDFHRSHQSNLIRKLESHYRPLFPNVPDDLPYIWPVQ